MKTNYVFKEGKLISFWYSQYRSVYSDIGLLLLLISFAEITYVVIIVSEYKLYSSESIINILYGS